jgi:predicted alpha/beta superfamily hydrolase
VKGRSAEASRYDRARLKPRATGIASRYTSSRIERVVGWSKFRRRFFPRRRVRTRALATLGDVWSPQLGCARRVTMYLPPSYDDSNRRYPVVYMQDGQNLFERSTSYAGDWGLVDGLDALAASGVEAIVAGVWNSPQERLNEYSPFRDAKHGGGAGERYLDFLVDTLKPLVDTRFHTEPAAESTGIGGSSMGGLISLYALLTRPVFGFASVQSPSVWFADAALLNFVASVSGPAGALYLDVGRKEGDRELTEVRRLHELLVSKGYRDGTNLMYDEDADGEHNEAAWGRRFPRALAFLFSRSRA